MNLTPAEARLAERADSLLGAHLADVRRRADRVFALLMVAQWLVAILLGLTVAPGAWAGRVSAGDVHVYAAAFLGALVGGLPVALVLRRPGAPSNGYVIAVAQMLWSALFIHLTGGRAETHFHVFASLAMLAFYRDWRVLVPATAAVALDHLLRGQLWPESIYGVGTGAGLRFFEHVFWVACEAAVLVYTSVEGVRELRALAVRHAEAELLSDDVRATAAELGLALTELENSQAARMRAEKLAAVGQLAAGIGHDLRNPLATIRNAATYIARRLTDPKHRPNGMPDDPRIAQFLGIMDRELNACSKIIGDLLDFARDRKPNRQPCPLRPLVDEVCEVVPAREGIAVENAVPDDLPVPHLDKDHMRQVLINLVQNAVEAYADGARGTVRVVASGGAGEAWQIRVVDDGPGFPEETAAKIFEPLFTTKLKGTGLGLAIVSNIVGAHQGTIRATSKPGQGTEFVIELPPRLFDTGRGPAAAAAPPAG